MEKDKHNLITAETTFSFLFSKFWNDSAQHIFFFVKLKWKAFQRVCYSPYMLFSLKWPMGCAITASGCTFYCFYMHFLHISTHPNLFLPLVNVHIQRKKKLTSYNSFLVKSTFVFWFAVVDVDSHASVINIHYIKFKIQ